MINDYQKKLADFYLSIDEKMRPEANRLSDYIDKVLVWVVSLSTASIALIISSMNNLNIIINNNKVNNTLLILLVSIIFGVIARVIDGITSYMSMKHHASFLASLYHAKIPFNPSKLTGEESIDDVIRYIKEDFDKDISDILIKICSNEPSEYKKDELARLFYDAYVIDSQKAYKNALEKINNEVNNSLGVNNKKYDKNINYNNYKLAKSKRRLQRCYFVFAIISLMSFTSSILYIAIAFIQINR